MPRARSIALLLAALSLPAGCAGEDAEPILPESGPAAEIFRRYVALGNSITAGVQSGGINDSTQLLAYPVLVARQAGARFTVPLFARPGCPPPLVAPFSSTRVGTVPGGCATRTPVDGPIQNLAVPGATIGSTSDLRVAANALTTFVLGGRTPVARMLEIEPTLVTAWIGNNDALGALLRGDDALLTPVDTFRAALDELVAAILRTPAGARDAVVLIGVVDPRLVPAAQPGLFAHALARTPAAAVLRGRTVAPDCAPTTASGEPNPLAANLVSLEILHAPGVASISCADRAPFVLAPAELAAISARVAAYNALIRARAEAAGWIYLDPNALLLPFLEDPAALRKCQAFATLGPAPSRERTEAALLATCPLPDVGFGTLLSHDGFHPSTAAHRRIADAVIEALNARFALAIPRLTT